VVWLLADLVWLIEVIAAAEMWQLCLFYAALQKLSSHMHISIGIVPLYKLKT